MNPFKKIIIATVASALVCQVMYLIASKGIAAYNVHKTSRLAELFLSSTAYDMLFIGSSRTHTTIEPRIIDSVLQVNSYNAGVEGGNLYEFKLTLEGYLAKHPSPRCLVLTLDIHSFDLSRKLYNYTQYLPFAQNPAIKQGLKSNGHNTAYFQILPFMELTAYDDYTRGNILKGLMGKTEIPEGDYQYKGYLSNTEKHIGGDSPTVLPTKKARVSKEGVTLLQAIIDTCKARNIALVFAYAPEYRHKLQDTFTNKEEVFDLIDSTAKRNQISFLRHDRLELCQNPALFANHGHVNKFGANAYSLILGNELRQL